ncbi:hypothetical protein, partial [Dermacoccus profundi]|uniref:hypothetical protein n=1 Tax=Dermacoccus profundi TaxID=322602 RepID=UPI0031F850ED
HRLNNPNEGTQRYTTTRDLTTKRGVRSGELPNIGVGSTEAERCDLTSRDVLDIVQHEIDELSRAASLLGDGQPESVARLRHQAAILTVVLEKAGH